MTTYEDAIEPHQFVGRYDRWCEVCNRPDRNPIHAPPFTTKIVPTTYEDAIEAGAEAFFVVDTRQAWADQVEGVKKWYRDATSVIIAALTEPRTVPCPTCGGTMYDARYLNGRCRNCTHGTRSVPPLLRWNEEA